MKSKQQCYMAFVYGSWMAFTGCVALFIFLGQYWGAGVMVLALPIIQWIYIRSFRWIAPWVGYGRIVDEPGRATGKSAVKVTLYTAHGCPFCPLMEKRIEELRKAMGFSLEKIDITFKPALLAAKGIRAVPVVEVGNRVLVGMSTTKRLIEAITGQSQRTTA